MQMPSLRLIRSGHAYKDSLLTLNGTRCSARENSMDFQKVESQEGIDKNTYSTLLYACKFISNMFTTNFTKITAAAFDSIWKCSLLSRIDLSSFRNLPTECGSCQL